MQTPEELLNTLMKLSTDDRARIARELLRSLDDAEDSDASAAWEQEVRRRSASVADGSAQLIDGEEVLKDIADRIAAIRSHR
jgi:putative addiction module component (TIGR02574 family)